MKQEIQFDMVPIAARNLRTMLDIADHVRRSGVWKCPHDIDHEVAITIKRLFDLLAWSDGRLDITECRLFDSLVRVEPEFGKILEALAEFSPADPLHSVIPPLLESVLEHDRAHGGRLAMLLVGNLEQLGYAIVAVNGPPLEVEQIELRTYVDSLRLWAQIMN